MESIEIFCLCSKFDLWYKDIDLTTTLYVCKCGHLDIEHIDNINSCLGVSELYE